MHIFATCVYYHILIVSLFLPVLTVAGGIIQPSGKLYLFLINQTGNICIKYLQQMIIIIDYTFF